MTEDRPGSDPKGSRRQNPPIYEALGRAIKVARAELGMERKDLAERAGISYAYLADVESGRGRPSSKVLMAIADALGMSPSGLMQAAEVRSTPRSTQPEEGWVMWERASLSAPSSSSEDPVASPRAELRMLIDQLDPSDVEAVLSMLRSLTRRSSQPPPSRR